MHVLAKLFPDTGSGENPIAVSMFYRMTGMKDFLKKITRPKTPPWPLVSGNYRVLNPQGQIAVCTLTSDDYDFIQPISQWENVAIIGTVNTPNLGIEKIILNTISNPNIRYLLMCGKDSPVFHAGQAIQSLFAYGINHEKRIINAIGHFPVLRNLNDEKINRFLKQVQLIDATGIKETDVLHQKINHIDMKEKPVPENNGLDIEHFQPEEETFITLKPGGKRIPLNYDEKGFFVITTDPASKKITVKHYYKDNRPGHIITGHAPEAILLAILENGLVSQMSHAGYLGAELQKAKTALKLNLNYVQDQPLKHPYIRK